MSAKSEAGRRRPWAAQPSKESFDAALIPGIRQRLALAYRSLRRSEEDAFARVLDERGEFLEGVAHVRDCPLCGSGSAGAETLLTSRGMRLVQCEQCSLVYSREVINQSADASRYRHSDAMESLMALHNNEAYATLEGNKAGYIVRRLGEFCPAAEAAFLDIGCSTGAVLAAAAERGWRGVGIDLNATAVQLARSRGLEALQGSYPDDLPSRLGPFDSVTMLDVLEHTEDPVTFLRSVSERVRPGGVIAIQVPNFDSLLIRIEGAANNNICHGHWSYFTAATLEKVAAAAGLRMESMETIISEVDRVLAHAPDLVLGAARGLTGRPVELSEIDHHWMHEHMLGYKLLGVFSRPR
jgi:2-polyprenyl-3-methyl-5-hydroxy-6-metoxy-1,4-benzoquinol methylase